VILENNLDKQPDLFVDKKDSQQAAPAQQVLPSHENVRGENYYKGA
jgi:hypothetical protein